MGIVLGLLSFWTGATKSVSVCGVNGAWVPRLHPHERRATLVYLIALYLGAATVVALMTTTGGLVAAAVRVPLQPRMLALAVVLLLLGTVELLRGPRVLPHVPWAIPRNWAEAGTFGLLAFGFIRGLAIFNHSPFASMHAWLLALIVVPPPALSWPIVALVLGCGLALWTIADWMLRILNLGQVQDALLHVLTQSTLTKARRVSALDGIALVAIGVAIGALALS